MSGGLYLNEVFRLMDEHMEFFWLYEIEMTGQRSAVVWPYGNRKVRIVVQVKPVLAYSKGRSLPRVSTLGLVRG